MDQLKIARQSYAAGNFGYAIRAYSKAIALNPNVASEAYEERGICYQLTENIEKAISDMNSAIASNPHNARRFLNRARFFEISGHNANALDDYNKALSIDPKYKDALNSRGLILLDLKEYNLALDDFNKVLEYSANCQSLNNRSLVYQELNQIDVSIKDLDRAIQLCPNYSHSYFNRGVRKVHKGNFKDAILDFDKAISLDQENGLFYNNRAIAYYLLKQQNQACDDWTLARKFGCKEAEGYLNKYCHLVDLSK